MQPITLNNYICRIHDVEFCAMDPAGYLGDTSKVGNDGWIHGPGSELLLWIPTTLRSSFVPPRTITLLGGYESRIDFTHFVHGMAWEQCAEPL